MTDSSCDLPAELLKTENIRVVPLVVNFEDGVYREGIDITPEAFYEKISRSVRLPKTSQPPPTAFAEAFRELSAPARFSSTTTP